MQQGTILKIPFYKQFIHNLHWKAHKIRALLKTKSQLTPFDLLKAIELFAAGCYQDSFKQGYNLQTRFKAATDNLYKKNAADGSRVSILNTWTRMEIVNISEKDLQEDAAFQRMRPVDALELLNQLIEERSEKAQREQELLCEFDDKNQETKWISLFGISPVETSLKAFFANPNPKEGLVLKGSKLIANTKLADLFAQTPNKGMRIRFLSLPESPLLADKEIRVLTTECPNLEYLNVSGCYKLNQFTTAEGEWPLLARLGAKDCLNLDKLMTSSPIKILRVGTARKIEVSVEKFTLDIFLISNKENRFEFSLRKAEGFLLKHQDQTVSHGDFFQSLLFKKEKIQEYFQDAKITLGKHLISSGEGLEFTVTVLNLRDSNLLAQDIQRISLLKLPNLKRLDLSRNKIAETESLIQANWPKLRHLDLSDNEINDKVLQILTQGNWPFLEALNLNNTKTTKKRLFHFHLKANLLNLKEINCNRNEKAFAEGFLPKNQPFLERLDLSSCQITQKEIKIILEKFKWPQLRHLDLSDNDIFDQGLALIIGQWKLLEEFHLKNTKITRQGIEIIVNEMYLPNLQKLDISENAIFDERLKLITSGNWPLFQHLVYRDIKITTKGNIALLRNLQWPNLDHLEHSLSESFYNYHENLGEWSPSEIIRASVPMYYSFLYGPESLVVTVLDMKLPNSKEIYLTISDDNSTEKAIILPRNKWDQLESIRLSLRPNQKAKLSLSYMWPPGLKTLDTSYSLFG